ncbi:hypothetical protein [Nostoc sp.]
MFCRIIQIWGDRLLISTEVEINLIGAELSKSA